MTVPSETIWSLELIAKTRNFKRYFQHWFPIVTKHHNQVIYVTVLRSWTAKKGEIIHFGRS